MIKRSKHSLSNTRLTTFDPGEFVPIGLQEVVPGDSFRMKTSAVIRALPLLAPVMHEVEIMITHAFIPHRLLWDDGSDSWENFITGGDDGLDASVLPTIDFSGSPVAKGDLANYLGLPIGFASTASALPFRAYQKFYNDHIMDEELQTASTIDLSGGTDSTTSTSLKNVNWARDRFTGANANEQLGSAISLPLGTSAPLEATGDLELTTTAAEDRYAKVNSADNKVQLSSNVTTGDNLIYKSGMQVDLSSATAATINELREAIALQKFAEMRQLYGSTYEKMIQADYGGIRPLDARLNNSEIISRGRGMLTFSEVLATAETGTSVDVGDMKGHAIAATRTNRFKKFFTEFGYLMSFATIRPKAVYMQGVQKHWIKSTKEDFYNKHLENMGIQQTIACKEVKHDHSTPDATWAYENKFDEYRRSENQATGEFADTGTLAYWHMARDLSGDPALNSSFITCSPTNRVFAQSATDNILGMFRHSIQARRLCKKSVRPVGLI